MASWKPRERLKGFVLRSLDIVGSGAGDLERICGFRVGAFAKGVALYRLQPRLVEWFVADPASHLASLGLYQVGYNNQRGPRDWDAMAALGDAGIIYNGYSAEAVRDNAAHYSPSATPYGPGDNKKLTELAVELTMLLANGGFVGKLLFPRETLAGLAPTEAYPAGGGIREYQLLRPQDFELVAELDPEAVRANAKLL